jgi:hypothetical protein
MFKNLLGGRGCRLLLIVCAFLVGRSATAQADGESLKGETRKVNDLTAVTLNLPAKSLLPALLWADPQGSAFFALEGDTGVLRYISFPDFRLVKKTDLERKFNWISLSAEGLLLSEADSDKMWIVDPATLQVKAKIVVPKLKRAVSAPSLSWAVACDLVQFPNQGLYVIDLKKKTATRWAEPENLRTQNPASFIPNFVDNSTAQFRPARRPPLNLDSPVVTPDGAHVFTLGDRMIAYASRWQGAGAVVQSNVPIISRFSFKGGRLLYEQATSAIAMADNLDSASRTVSISSDSTLVCMPWYDADTNSFSTPVYPVASFDKHKFTLPRIWSTAVGFDLKAGCVYACDYQHDVMVFTLHGVKKAEYLVGRPARVRMWTEGVRHYLVHPGGKKFVMLKNDAAYFVAMP